MNGQWRRAFQLLHFALLGAVPALYAAVVTLVPAEDPVRVLLSLSVAVVTALWAGLVVIEGLRSGSDETLRHKLYAAYRRLLLHGPTLVGSTIAFVTVSAFLVYVLLWFRQVEFFNQAPMDVTVYLEDADTERVLTSVPPGERVSARLRVGTRYVFFSPSGDEIRPFQPRVIAVRMWPAPGPSVTIDDRPIYED